MKSSILAVIEHDRRRPDASSADVLAACQRITQATGLPIVATLIGQDVEEACRAVANNTGLRTIGVSVPGPAAYNREVWSAVLSDLAEELGARYICAAHTAQGADFAPGLAIRLAAACVTAVERIVVENGELGFVRSIFGGKIQSTIASVVDVTVLTTQRGSFRSELVPPVEVGKCEIRSVELHPGKTRSLGVKRESVSDSGLADARVIVAAGRGIGAAENLTLVEKLAALFPKSAVAGSRPVCDMGWLPYQKQVGLTGATVSPKLYLALGISGAIQHVAGMNASECVVAVNKDPAAAMFNWSDICVVADLETFIPALMDELEKRNQTGRGAE